MFTRISLLPLFACLVLLLSSCTPPPNSSGRISIQSRDVSIDVAFSDHDRALIHQHYYHRPHQKQRYKSLPPGLAKKGKLPPGIRKQLVRHGRLPDGVTYRYLPAYLERRMSPLPTGYMRVIIDNSIVLLNTDTRVIFDVIHDF